MLVSALAERIIPFVHGDHSPGGKDSSMFRCVVVLGLLLAAGSSGVANPEASSVHFFGRGPQPLVDLGSVDPGVPSPEAWLGFPLGERPVRHAQVIQYFRLLDSVSDRVAVFSMGATYEGRELIYAVISSPERMAKLDLLRADLRSLRDPRALSSSQTDELVKRLPASVWLAYSIHGDEISGVDAALGVAYRLAAGTDSVTAHLLN